MLEHPFVSLQPVDRRTTERIEPPVVFSHSWKSTGAILGFSALFGLALASKTKRFNWLKRYGLAGLVGIGTIGLVQALAGIWRLQIERHTLKLPNWDARLNGLKIAHLSDLHLGPRYTQRILRQALAAIADFQPDLIVLTGDFVDHVRHLPLLSSMLAGISAPLGVFACLGNHDYWEDPAAIAQTLHELGIQVLVNTHQVIQWRDQEFIIAGVADPWVANADLDQALTNAPELPIILLAHGPDFIRIAACAEVALQLSGHAHAGHINAPYLGPLVLPRWGIDYPHGQYLVGNSYVYVSRGMGGLPIRFWALPEVGLLTLERGVRG